MALAALLVPFHQVEAAQKKAALTKSTGYTMERDELCRLMSKKLGTPYSKMDCSAYAAWVIKNMGSRKADENTISSVKVISNCSTYAWKEAGKYKISCKVSVYNEKKQKWVWGKRKTVSLNKKMVKWNGSNTKAQKKASASLEVGEALLYEGGEHIAYYFGKFDSIDKVASYLKKNCGMKKLQKGKTGAGNTCYRYKGKIVLVEYAGYGKNWRIHSTSSNGVIIDNDLTFHNGTYGGKWYATVKFVEVE